MKLSNKILIGFFGFAFIYLTAVFAEVRLKGTPNIIDDHNSIAQNVDISGVTYLIFEDLDQDIAVTGSDQALLEVRSISGGLLERLKYKISGDTLTLSDLQSEPGRPFKITVFVPKASLEGIRIKAAGAVVKGLEQQVLYVSQNAGRIQMFDNEIGTVHLEVSDRSYSDISQTELDTLSANIDNSEVLIGAPIRFLGGTMINNSHLRAGDINEIQFKKDASSRLSVYY